MEVIEGVSEVGALRHMVSSQRMLGYAGCKQGGLQKRAEVSLCVHCMRVCVCVCMSLSVFLCVCDTLHEDVLSPVCLHIHTNRFGLAVCLSSSDDKGLALLKDVSRM